MKTMPPASTCRLVLPLFFAGALVCLSSCSDNPSSPPPGSGTSQLPTTLIEVTSPARSAMVSGGTIDVSPLTATGTACDSVSEITSVTVDGRNATLSGSPPCLDFEAPLDSRWGLNIIQGSSDNVTDNTATFAQSYLRSPSYFAATPTPVSRASSAAAEPVPTGVYIHLNRKVIDDGVRATGSVSELDDFASIFDWQLKHTDLNTSLPSPLIPLPGTKTCDCLFPVPDIVIHQTGYGVTRGTLGYDDPSVHYILPRDGGFDGQGSITNLSLPVTVTGYLGSCVTSCTDRLDHHASANGTIYLDRIVMDLSADVSLGVDGRPVVAATVSNFELTGLRLDIDWGPLEFLDPLIGLSNMTTYILNVFQDYLEDAIATILGDQLTSTAESFIDSFEPPSTVTLPPPMNTMLNFTSELDFIDIDFNAARVGIASAVSPAETVLTSPMGSIRRNGGAPAFASAPYGLGAGLKDDMLNEFLWAAWRGGALEIDDLSALGVSVPAGFDVRMSATLPPVVMPGTGGHQVDVGLGDVYIEATPSGGSAATGSIALYASGLAGATLTLDNDTYRLILTVEPDPLVALQVVRLPENTELATLTAQYTALFESAFARALGTLVASYPMPTISLADMGLTGAPPDSHWELSGATVDRQDPYTTITGDVVVR